MKKIYRAYIKFIENFLGFNQNYKMFLAENYALWKKRKIIRNVNWEKYQIDEFNDFWKKNYKRIKSSGHRLLQAFNGVYNKEYIPDFLYATKIESTFNPHLYAKIYSDKSLLDVLYKDKSTAILPKTYLINTSGIYYNPKREIVSLEKVKIILSGIDSAVIKPIIDGNSGKGVIVANFDKVGFDSKNNFNIFSLLEEKRKNFIIQEKIIQSFSLNELYPNSINTFRVITYISNHKIHLAPISLRLGTGGSNVDNIHAGGIAIGVNEINETLLEYGYQLGYSNSFTKHKFHPDTGIPFLNFKIKGIKEITDAAIKLHGFTPHIGIISWDFTLNTNNTPVLIEANFIGQAVWLSQIVNAKPIFGDETINILNRIKQ